MWRTHDGLAWLMLLAVIFSIAFLGLVAHLVTSSMPGHGAAPAAPPDPLEIAQRRYAAGVISREQYVLLCADLTAPPADVRQDAMSGERADQ
jgi:uncharacterized membrane protein